MGTLTKTVGKRIRELRKAYGLSQEDLAGRASVHSTYIGQLERGERNVSLETIVKITNALGISLSQFFIYQEEENESPKDIAIMRVVSLLKDRPIEDVHLLLNLVKDLLAWKYNPAVEEQ